MTTDNLINLVTAEAVELRRRLLSNYYHDMFKGKIQQGPLKGFTVPREPIWGSGDVATKLLGLYEQEVLNLIEAAIGRKSIFVNLGAADGYYGVGLVATNSFSRSVCFEMSDSGRSIIDNIAREHGVRDKVLLFEAADSTFPEQLVKTNISPRDVFLLCDVEGAEFHIFDDHCLSSMQHSEIVIELHEFLFSDGAEKLQELFDRARRYYEIRLFKTGFRDLSGIPEVDHLGDSDRWLLCSEGRGKMMTWMHLTSR